MTGDTQGQVGPQAHPKTSAGQTPCETQNHILWCSESVPGCGGQKPYVTELQMQRDSEIPNWAAVTSECQRLGLEISFSYRKVQ